VWQESRERMRGIVNNNKGRAIQRNTKIKKERECVIGTKEEAGSLLYETLIDSRSHSFNHTITHVDKYILVCLPKSIPCACIGSSINDVSLIWMRRLRILGMKCIASIYKYEGQKMGSKYNLKCH